MTRREFAERLAMLADEYEVNCYPVAEVIQTIHEIEGSLASGETERIVKWLEDEIEEYDEDEDTRYHADAAKELLTALKEGDIYD